ncbi:MAG: PDZ domain-containing protein [Planctomycetes bacterium]|nr:PDZ domain-containing protein [Planctomycetota bacterium]
MTHISTRRTSCRIWALVVLLAFAVAAQAQEKVSRRRTPVVEAVQQVADTVANLSTERIRVIRYYDSPFSFRDRFLNRFYDDYFGRYTDRPYKVESPIGSGIIIDKSGYILTNDHVVSKASNLKITLSDKSRYEGTLVSSDPVNDLAVIKVEPDKPLHEIKLGKGDDLMLGETVIALGNPIGFENTVTTGVISALDRELTLRNDEGQITYKGLVQTDAAINPGNSGGPLINLDCELVGINTAIVDSAQGIGFAIPVSHVRKILNELLNFRKLSKAWMGLKVIDSKNAVKVDSVADGGPAKKAGMQPGDILATADGVPLDCVLTFTKHMVSKHVGQAVNFKVQRGPRTLTIRVPIESAPKPSAQGLALKLFGMRVQDLTAALIQELGLHVRSGVLVYGVEAGSPAARIGLRSGDVIVQASGQRVNNLDEAGVVLDNIHSGEMVDIWVVRGLYLLNARMRAR